MLDKKRKYGEHDPFLTSKKRQSVNMWLIPVEHIS